MAKWLWLLAFMALVQTADIWIHTAGRDASVNRAQPWRLVQARAVRERVTAEVRSLFIELASTQSR